jgi:hypothetical protein
MAYDDEAVQTDMTRVPLFQIFRAKVANDVSDLTDELFVTIPQIEDEDDPRGVHEHGPCYGWDERSDGLLPKEGDAATVFVDDTGDYWINNWDPNA